MRRLLASSAVEVSLEQRSPEWLAWRKDGITATEAVIVARGEQFGKTEAELFDEKIGKVIPKLFDELTALKALGISGKVNIKHIPKVLYHWRAHDISTATNQDSKLYAYEAGKRAIEDHLRRQTLSGKVLYTEHLGFFRVKYDPGKLKCIEMTGDELSMYNEEMLRALPADAIMIKDAKLEALNKDYLEELLGNMNRDEVGAVGGKILYKDGRIGD